MHASRRPVSGQQRRVRHHAVNADSDTMFNLLTGPRLLERVEASLPEHRERLFPPTQTLAMFVGEKGSDPFFSVVLHSIVAGVR